MECAPIKPRDGCSVLLVVDDYPENLISMRALLQREDWHVVTAASGIEALGLLLEHDVDLVLLDVMMPGMDGFEVARLMRGSQRTQMTPIIFLSAHAQSPAAVLEGYASGAIDYLLKPFDPNILKPKVQALLEHQRNRRALQRLSHDLESARAFNASVLDNAAEGILVVGEDGVISYANPAISRLLNAPVAELQGAEFLAFCKNPTCLAGLTRPCTKATSAAKPGACTTRSCVPRLASNCRWRCRARRCRPSRKPWWSRCWTCPRCAICISSWSSRRLPTR